MNIKLQNDTIILTCKGKTPVLRDPNDLKAPSNTKKQEKLSTLNLIPNSQLRFPWFPFLEGNHGNQETTYLLIKSETNSQKCR